MLPLVSQSQSSSNRHSVYKNGETSRHFGMPAADSFEIVTRVGTTNRHSVNMNSDNSLDMPVPRLYDNGRLGELCVTLRVFLVFNFKCNFLRFKALVNTDLTRSATLSLRTVFMTAVHLTRAVQASW